LLSAGRFGPDLLAPAKEIEEREIDFAGSEQRFGEVLRVLADASERRK
jgi:hypothetical protein